MNTFMQYSSTFAVVQPCKANNFWFKMYVKICRPASNGHRLYILIKQFCVRYITG